MNTRERTLSIFLLTFIGVAGFAFVGYQFILSPLWAKDTQIATLHRDIDKKLGEIKAIQNRKPDLDRWKKMSLPAEANGLRYWDTLSESLRASGFAVNSTTIGLKGTDNKTVPMMADKKTPIFTKLSYGVSVKGDLLTLVDWMERFYKLPLLHQIHSLTITRPLNSGGGGGGRGGRGGPGGGGGSATDHLDITMTIDALVLNEIAEKRAALLPDLKPSEMPPVLATKERQYGSIAGKNLFYGPYRDQGGLRGPQIDSAQYIRLNGITGTGDNMTASLFDMYNNHNYEITTRLVGGYRVLTTYPLRGRPTKLRDSTESVIEIHDTQNNVKKWVVVRIGDRELTLRDHDDAQKYYKLRIGQALSEMAPLSRAEVGTLGIKAPAPPSGDVADKDK